jgi:Protein of unknown function (DUF2442)
MSILAINKSHKAIHVAFAPHKMMVQMADGREISFLLAWFPRLADATPEQLNNWRFIGNGEGIHWPDLDEDILVAHLLD